MNTQTHTVMVGSIAIGGDAPVVIQSMTNTDTADADATARQIIELAEDVRRGMFGPLDRGFSLQRTCLTGPVSTVCGGPRQVPDQPWEHRAWGPRRRQLFDHLPHRPRQ